VDTSLHKKVSCTTSTFRQLKELAEVPEEQLEWLLAHGSCLVVAKDDQLFKPGDPTDTLQIVLEGKMRFYMVQQGEQRIIGEFDAPYISGVLPYSRMVETSGFSVALEDTHIFCVHRDHFPEMIRENYELTAAFVHQMTTRVRNFTALQQQDEKLMSLGKLSAGLAHELNNPSSAVIRSAQELKKHLHVVPENFKNVIKIRMEEAEIDSVNKMLFEKIAALDNVKELSLMERTDLEDELANWLEDHGVEDGYALSENLVDFGFSEDDLRYVLEHTSESHFVPVINWVNSNLVTERMVMEIEEASNRISELVRSVKSYTHMDQSKDKQPVDVHNGLKSTVTMLAHKIKKQQLVLDKQLQEDLPEVMGFPGEMNQVFTNILDNAIDALKDIEGAKLTIKTVADNDFLRVYIRDNGPGIPEDVVDRIFDPFFTTKGIGEGTGMGLDVVKKIMEHHRGKVEVTSEPGATEFCLCFPIKG